MEDEILMSGGNILDRGLIGVILAGNFAIALVQFNLGAIYPLIPQDFGHRVSGLGFASSAMFLGICIS